jgi:hypothetical protein
MTDTTNADSPSITRRLVPESERMAFVDKLFGLSYVLKLEPTVFRFAEQLAANYDYGYWEFFSLNNGGFYFAPRTDTIYIVSCDNGFDGQMTADALGVTACLYAYSNLSFDDGVFAQTCANHFHWLREFAMDHAEVRSILRAID